MWTLLAVGAVLLVVMPATLLMFGLRPSPLGWAVLGALAAACFALAALDAVRLRRTHRDVARV